MKQSVALIAGPTASGKSDLAVRLALAIEQHDGRAVVINADSAQVYADLCQLSARPSPDEMRGINHRLFGTWDGAEPCSAADWAAAAKNEIFEVHDEGALPILVGGTGLYIRTLLDGIAPIPEIDPEIRKAVRTLPIALAYQALTTEDPERAVELNPNDAQRIARALEVVRSTGRTLGSWQEEKCGGIADEIDLHPLILLPDRAWLYERCDRRFELMIHNGAVDEVANLIARRLDPALPVMRAIGVAEIVAMLKGELSRTKMIEAGQQATRNYAKRQYTWFRRQPPSEWHRIESQDVNVTEEFISLLRACRLT